jgi:hypothetical protein
VKYKFKYKRLKSLFSKTYKDVIGHKLSDDGDRMDIFFDDGIISISKWKECNMYLGQDFILAEKESIKKEVGR